MHVLRSLAATSILIAVLASSPAFAADASCEAQASEKKLAGAAKNSFLKKCSSNNVSPAQAACEATATEKKLAGAARNSFLKKCVADTR